MELPVGDFITNALATDVPSNARELLLSNVTDEENHDVALGYIANAHGVDEKAEAEALKLREAWVSHQITQLQKRWLPSVQFSLYSCRFFALTVVLAHEL